MCDTVYFIQFIRPSVSLLGSVSRVAATRGWQERTGRYNLTRDYTIGVYAETPVYRVRGKIPAAAAGAPVGAACYLLKFGKVEFAQKL